jgi:hypothetical protein
VAKATATKATVESMTPEASLAIYEEARSKYEAEWNKKSAELTANKGKAKDVDVPHGELKALADEYKAKTTPLWEAHLARMAGVEVVEEDAAQVDPDGSEDADKDEEDAAK